MWQDKVWPHDRQQQTACETTAPFSSFQLVILSVHLLEKYSSMEPPTPSVFINLAQDRPNVLHLCFCGSWLLLTAGDSQDARSGRDSNSSLPTLPSSVCLVDMCITM